MTYQRPVKYASHARIARVQQRGYADRQAGKRKKDNPYKNQWDRDNWLIGWEDADIDIKAKTDPELMSHARIPF